MTIGDKNRYIGIWKHSGAADSANQPLPDDWVLYKNKWARVKGDTGMGTIRAAAQAGGVNTPLDRYSFRVDYDPTIDIGMQLREVDGSRSNIIAVRHDKADREWTDIIVETGGANG